MNEELYAHDAPYTLIVLVMVLGTDPSQLTRLTLSRTPNEI